MPESEIHKASPRLQEWVEKLEAVRDRRQELQTEETGLEDVVTEMMRKEKVEIVVVDSGRLCTLTATDPKIKAKFTTPKEDG